MRPHQLLSLAALTGSVAAELCGTVGTVSTLPYYTSTSPTLYNAVACGEHCALDVECQTYALGLGMCLHFASPSSNIFQELPSSPWTLYDRDCTPIESHRSQLVPLGARCLINPNSTKSQFRLLGPDFVPLVTTAEKKLQPRPTPALGDEDRIRVIVSGTYREETPRFFFQKAASAPAGLYDLVVAGSEMQYVAKAADGEVVFTSASTGPTAENVNGRAIVTSIFTVDCDGRIGVMHEGVHYNYNISSNGNTTLFTAGAHIPDSTLVAFDVDAFGISRSHHELRSLVKRGDKRCPAGQRAIAKPNIPAWKSNGCGSGWTARIVPELGFGQCCNGHDLCYANCAEQSCISCNDDFYNCMKDRCKGHSFFKRQACLLAAKTYYEATENLGCPAFQDRTEARCKCV